MCKGETYLDNQAAKLIPGKSLSPVIYRCLDDIEAVPIDWLWRGNIAKGKPTLIAGHPGLGKSQVSINLAATVSTGGTWPVDNSRCPVGNIIFLSAEDDASDTIRPRLEAAGANLKNIFILDAVKTLTPEGEKGIRTFDLGTDLVLLEQMIEQIGEVSLIVIDPITAYLGNADSHKTADVRALLAPLSMMAAEHHAAIVCISHLNKSGKSDALLRVTGSLAFVAAVRAAFLVAKDEQEDRILFVPMKNNIGNDKTGFAFSIESHVLDGGIETSRIKWHSESVDVSANDVLVCVDPEDRSALDEAKAFLNDVLKNGPLLSKDVLREGREAGHAEKTIRRAKTLLNITSDKNRLDGKWQWVLPNMAKGSPCQNVGHLGHVDHLQQNQAVTEGKNGQKFEDGQGGQHGRTGDGDHVDAVTGLNPPFVDASETFQPREK